jgi:drug/metabolite transporter (DMT)-like permease
MFGVLFGWLVRDEVLGGAEVVGGAFVIAGVFLLVTSNARRVKFS